jgi:hypothetical protein
MENETQNEVRDESKDKVKADMRESALISGLQTAIIENNYDNFNNALAQIQEYVDTQSDITDTAQKTEEFARLVMSSRADISGENRNVFMISLNNTRNGNLEDSILYKFAKNYNLDNERDTRVLSLLGRSVDANGKTVYDYLLSLNPREMKRNSAESNAYGTILSSIKKAMDKDAERGHPVPTEIKEKINVCALEKNIWNALYEKELKQQRKKLHKELGYWPSHLIEPYKDIGTADKYDKDNRRSTKKSNGPKVEHSSALGYAMRIYNTFTK